MSQEEDSAARAAAREHVINAINKARSDPERAMNLVTYMRAYVRDCAERSIWLLPRSHPQDLFAFDYGYRMLLEYWPTAAVEVADVMQTKGFEPRHYSTCFNLGITKQEAADIIKPAPALPPEPLVVEPSRWQRIQRWLAQFPW